MAGVIFTEKAGDRIADTVRWAEGERGRRPGGPTGGGLEPTFVRVTSSSSDGNGNYPGVITVRAPDGDWQDYSAVKLKPLNGESLISGTRYGCRGVGFAPGGEELYAPLAGGAAAGGGNVHARIKAASTPPGYWLGKLVTWDASANVWVEGATWVALYAPYDLYLLNDVQTTNDTVYPVYPLNDYLGVEGYPLYLLPPTNLAIGRTGLASTDVETNSVVTNVREIRIDRHLYADGARYNSGLEWTYIDPANGVFGLSMTPANYNAGGGVSTGYQEFGGLKSFNHGLAAGLFLTTDQFGMANSAISIPRGTIGSGDYGGIRLVGGSFTEDYCAFMELAWGRMYLAKRSTSAMDPNPMYAPDIFVYDRDTTDYVAGITTDPAAPGLRFVAGLCVGGSSGSVDGGTWS